MMGRVSESARWHAGATGTILYASRGIVFLCIDGFLIAFDKCEVVLL